MIKRIKERSQRLIKKILGMKEQPTMIEKCANFVACEKLSLLIAVNNDILFTPTEKNSPS